jgi:hypothetical protein
MEGEMADDTQETMAVDEALALVSRFGKQLELVAMRIELNRYKRAEDDRAQLAAGAMELRAKLPRFEEREPLVRDLLSMADANAQSDLNDSSHKKGLSYAFARVRDFDLGAKVEEDVDPAFWQRAADYAKALGPRPADTDDLIELHAEAKPVDGDEGELTPLEVARRHCEWLRHQEPATGMTVLGGMLIALDDEVDRLREELGAAQHTKAELDGARQQVTDLTDQLHSMIEQGQREAAELSRTRTELERRNVAHVHPAILAKDVADWKARALAAERERDVALKAQEAAELRIVELRKELRDVAGELMTVPTKEEAQRLREVEDGHLRLKALLAAMANVWKGRLTSDTWSYAAVELEAALRGR